MKFIRFKRKGGLEGLRCRRIPLHHQNLGGTIFAGTWNHFCTEFGHDSRTEERTVVGASPSSSSSNYTYREGKSVTILETCQLSKMTLPIVIAFLWVNLWNSFDLKEKVVLRVYVVDKFESIIKIKVAPFLMERVPIFARNLGMTPERWVIRSWESLHLLPRRILHMERAN